MIRLDDDRARPFFADDALENLRPQLEDAHRKVLDGSGEGGEMLGWRRLLHDPNDALLEDLTDTAEEIRRRADVLVCIGIGGSYLGAKAVVQALTPYFRGERRDAGKNGGEEETKDQKPKTKNPEILFAGNQLSGAYLRELLAYLDGKSVYVNVISKSGTTLEPALAFRLVRRFVDERFDDADRRIIVTTDPSEGALNELQSERGFRKYAIPRDVGGRFSVLTPVGLLPIAAAGLDVQSLFYGAADAMERLSEDGGDPLANDALRYAALRYALLQEGYAAEVLAHFEPRLAGVGAWWQQLFGESEGKQGTGLYPTTAQFSTDLHSLGQYLQQGRRSLVETFLMLDDDDGNLEVPHQDANLDALNYLAGRTFSDVTRSAYEGTAEAHAEGDLPNMTIRMPRLDAGTLGELIYFFEHAVAASGYLLGVNPFNQPGVEAYKNAMFRLLGRPSS